GWTPDNPPTKNWVLFEASLIGGAPVVVGPGEFFEAAILFRNDSFGPDFTSTATGNSPTSRTNAVGEAVWSVDVDYKVVPEPASLLLASGLGGVFIFATRRRKAC
ncbi:MAG: PEP-CTERM sorting domain-containing protein, partial [Planctomycetales bacterium]|nr:PEP-CTERM sorting domain-containing protein [Planctomycetales bacterium]